MVENKHHHISSIPLPALAMSNKSSMNCVWKFDDGTERVLLRRDTAGRMTFVNIDTLETYPNLSSIPSTAKQTSS